MYDVVSEQPLTQSAEIQLESLGRWESWKSAPEGFLIENSDLHRMVRSACTLVLEAWQLLVAALRSPWY